MHRSGDRLVDVELVEDDDTSDGVVHGSGPGGVPASGDDRPARRPWSAVGRIPREVGLTAVAALLLGGAGVAVAEVGAERARDARLAEVPGLVTSLADPLREDWSAPGGDVIGFAGDVVVHWDEGIRGVVGADLRDGSPRYTAPGECGIVSLEGDGGLFTGGFGAAVQAGPGDVLLCLDGRGRGSLGEGVGTVRVLDPGTGETRRTIAGVTGDWWDVVDGDLVGIGLDDERRVVAGRWSLTSGEQRWSHHGAEPVEHDPSDGWSTTRTDTVVGLEADGWSVHLDLETGVETGADPGGGSGGPPEEDDAATQRVELPDGRVLEYGASDQGLVETTVHPAGGGEPTTVPGVVPQLAVDDGSVPGGMVAFDVNSTPGAWELGVVDLASGDWRWRSAADGGGVALVSGSVLVTDGQRTTAFDARTAEVRWRTTPGPSQPYSGSHIVTDGRSVLLLESEGLERVLVAHDVRTGERLWDIEAPVAEGTLVPAPDGTVLMVGRQTVVALRP